MWQYACLQSSAAGLMQHGTGHGRVQCMFQFVFSSYIMRGLLLFAF
jgi:hypothetical protein